MTVSVLVADAQLLFCEVVAEALGDHESLTVVPERPASAAALLSAVERHRPDVVLADYYLDVTPAERLLADITARAPATKVIFLSWLHEADAVEGALAAGAAGYLPKSCDVDLVAEAACRAQSGESPVFGRHLDRLLDDLEERRRTAQKVAERMETLTARELEVLHWLAAGYTKEEIAEELDIRPRTVQTHIVNLKAKTGARTQVEAVRMAQGKAAVWLPDRLPR